MPGIREVASRLPPLCEAESYVDINMNEEFANLLTELYRPPSDVFRIARSMKTVPGHEAMLLDELQRQVDLDDEPKILFLLWAVSLAAPSPVFTPILCLLLEEKKGCYYLEAAVDAMHDVADEASVACLRAALGREEPWDQDFAFNRKILWALERIGTPEAVDAIRSALNNKHARISETAEEILERLGGWTTT